jgi:hypothetical protein
LLAFKVNLYRYTVARGDSAEAAAVRLALITRAGAFTDVVVSGDDTGGTGGGDGATGGDQRMLQFELRLGLPPKVLAGIAGLMCCSPEEATAIAAALGTSSSSSSGGGVVDDASDVAHDAAPIAFVDIEGRVTVQLAPESRRRAGRYVAYILKQVEPVVCGGDRGDDDDDEGVDTFGEVPDGVDAETWRAAYRLQSGARGVFRAAEAPLDDNSLLSRGEWIDAAVADLLIAY